MKNLEFLFWAYNIIWVGIAGYMLFVFLRTRRLDRRLEGLERELGERPD